MLCLAEFLSDQADRSITLLVLALYSHESSQVVFPKHIYAALSLSLSTVLLEVGTVPFDRQSVPRDVLELLP